MSQQINVATILGLAVCLCAGSAWALPEAPLGSPTFVGKSTASVLESMGWQTESHMVRSDGYYLGLTRMINPLVTDKSQVRRSVLFSHGILSDSIGQFLSFAHYVRPKAPTPSSYSEDVYAGEDSQLGLLGEATNATYERMCMPCLFSNNNYDVWIGNDRGSTLDSSQVYDERLKHESQYWNFTIDASATVDLPNQLDYILNVTGRDQLSYVGYSKSTLHMHILLSEKPEYADKLAAYVGLGPVAYPGEIRGPFRLFAILAPFIANINKPYASLKVTEALDTVLSLVCKAPAVRTSACRALFNALAGPDDKYNVLTETFFGHAFAPNSLKTLAHFGQLVSANQVQKFDFGSASKNQAAYGESKPPQYNLAAIRSKKIILVHSRVNDDVSTSSGVDHFISTLTVPLFRDIVTPPEYNHYSYLVAKDAFSNVFKPALQAVNAAYLTDDDSTGGEPDCNC